MGFSTSLQYGKVGESKISCYLRIRRGCSVLPVYEKEINEGKGPQLFCPSTNLIAPDMLVYKGLKIWWIEAKHKTAFAWHRISKQWTTGIDLRHYRDYLKVNEVSPWSVWLLFLHEGGQAKDSPPDSPSGLFGNSLKYLSEHESHRWSYYGKSGMVYWGKKDLKKIATLQEVNEAFACYQFIETVNKYIN